jgi:hypothetical protein
MLRYLLELGTIRHAIPRPEREYRLHLFPHVKDGGNVINSVNECDDNLASAEPTKQSPPHPGTFHTNAVL